jgi:hypothetical protein
MISARFTYGGGHFSHRYAKLEPPLYAEGFELISEARDASAAARLAGLYRQLGAAASPPPPAPSSHALGGSRVRLPSVMLGTMKLRGDRLDAALGAGFAGVDSAPTASYAVNLP